MGREIEPLGATGRTFDPAFLQRLPEPLVHEPLLGFAGLPNFEDRPAILRRPGGVYQ